MCLCLVIIFLHWQGGMYMLQLFDNYAATYSLLFIGMIECIGIAWVYGKFARIWLTWTLGQDLLVWLPLKKFISQTFQMSKFRYDIKNSQSFWNVIAFWCNLRYEGVFDVLYLNAWDVTFRWFVSSIFEAVWNTSLLHRAYVKLHVCLWYIF